MSTIGVGALERGDRRTPYRETVTLLAAALGLSAADRARLEVAGLRTARPRRRSAVATSEIADFHNLPHSLTSFIGRESEVSEILALVQGYRLVTVTGTGGIGKTRTALQIGSSVCDATSAKVWFVDLAPLGEASLVAAAVATTLGIKESPDRPLLDTLSTHLKQKNLVLVLDNCEHVIGEAALVAETLLRGCPGLRILATSREPLRIAGERTYRLPSLRTPSLEATPHLGADAAAQFGAIALFTERANAIDARFALTDENARSIAEICRRLDGIPLAIELAAARVGSLPIKALLEKLDERFRLLTDGGRTALRRHQTMRALIDWSYDLLSEQESTLFRRLSIFAGGFTLDSVAAVCAYGTIAEPDVLHVLASLIDKSFVQADFEGDDARYRLLESARQYAHEKLIERNEHAAAADSHAAAMVQLAERLESEWLVSPDKAWLVRVEAEQQNWRAALAWSLGEGGDARAGQRITGALRLAWWYLAAWEGQRWITAGRRAVDRGTPPRIAARLELAAAYLFGRYGRFAAAMTASERALAIFGDVDDPFGRADAHRCLGRILLLLERVDEGESHARLALDGFRQIGARKMVGLTLEDLGNARSLRDDLAAARALYGEAIAIFNSTGADRLAARIGIPLAEAEFRGGNPEAALLAVGEALSKHRTFNDVRFVEVALSNAAAYLVALGRLDDARTHAREALTLALDDQGGSTVWALQHLAAVAALQGAETPEGTPETLRHAAELLGFVEARLPQLDAFREYAEQLEYERVYALLHDALGEGELRLSMAAGGTFTEDQAIERALSI